MVYDLIQIVVVLVLAYIVSYALYRGNRINKSTHGKLWNILILVSFIITAGMGIILAFFADFGLNVSVGININYWHSEIGIAFFTLIILHLHWNWGRLRKLMAGPS